MIEKNYTDKSCCQKRKYIDDIVMDFFNNDEERFKTWLTTPNEMLGGKTPMKTSINKLYSFVKDAMDSNESASGGSCLGYQ